MNVLLTNDDGIHAPGLEALVRAFVGNHDVTVIAPDRERSAVSHGITLQNPIRVTQLSLNGGFPGMAVTGTPVDCIKLGVIELLKKKPDLVVSGINPGENVGVNLNYSGTVAAAREAALYGIPAIAVSVRAPASTPFDDAARFIVHLAQQVKTRGLSPGTLLNVNIPDIPMADIAGIRISKQGTTFFPEYFEKRQDPRRRTYYWQGCDAKTNEKHKDIDGVALLDGFISITPIQCDMTDHGMLDDLKNWKIGISD